MTLKISWRPQEREINVMNKQLNKQNSRVNFISYYCMMTCIHCDITMAQIWHITYNGVLKFHKTFSRHYSWHHKQLFLKFHDITIIIHNFATTDAIFHNSPYLQNGLTKFCCFPIMTESSSLSTASEGCQWPAAADAVEQCRRAEQVRTDQESTTPVHWSVYQCEHQSDQHNSKQLLYNKGH